MSTPIPLPYTYERGDGRWKHCWNKPEAGFVPGDRGQVGKCSNILTDALALSLLQSGLFVPLDDEEQEEDEHPSEIFNVHRGVVYVAVPTRPGLSYHGYPYRGNLTRTIYDELAARASALGFAKEFKEWRKHYIENY